MRYLGDLKNERLETLEIMKTINLKYENLQTRKLETEEFIQGLSIRIHHLKMILDALKTRRTSYHNEMISIIEQAIRYGVNKINCNKIYDVELVPSLYRGQNILKLYFVDEAGKRLPPKIIEGDMLNQVLSFSAVVILSYQNGIRVIYYDEAFASANARSLVVIRELIREYLSMGMKFIFVTQSPILLAGLDRKVIELISGDRTIQEVLEYYVDAKKYTPQIDQMIINLFDKISEGGITDESFANEVRRLTDDSTGESLS